MDVLRNPVRWIRMHPRVADVLLFLLITPTVLAFGLTAEVKPGQREMGGLAVFLIIAMHVPLIWRRRYPVRALWASVLLTLPFWVLDYPDDPTGANLLILLYGLAAHEGRPRSIKHFWAVLAVLSSVLLAGILSNNDDLPWFAPPATAGVPPPAWRSEERR